MFKRNYHYLVAGLPDIIPDQKKVSLTIIDFRQELEYHLHADDFSLIKLLFLPYDNTNLTISMNIAGINNPWLVILFKSSNV